MTGNLYDLGSDGLGADHLRGRFHRSFRDGGVDLEGYAGFHYLVDNHYLKIFRIAILMSLVMAVDQISQPEAATAWEGRIPARTPTMGQAAMGSL